MALFHLLLTCSIIGALGGLLVLARLFLLHFLAFFLLLVVQLLLLLLVLLVHFGITGIRRCRTLHRRNVFHVPIRSRFARTSTAVFIKRAAGFACRHCVVFEVGRTRRRRDGRTAAIHTRPQIPVAASLFHVSGL